MDVTRLRNELVRRGYEPDPACLDVIAGLDGLTLTWERQRADGTMGSDILEFDSGQAAMEPRSRVAKYEFWINDRLCPLGLVFGKNAALYVSSSGAIYMEHEPQLFCMGGDIWEALSVLTEDIVSGGVEIFAPQDTD